MFKFAIDRVATEQRLRKPWHGKRLALLGHPASLTTGVRHSLDVLMALEDIRISCAFGPQHGMRGDKQDNMVESGDYHDPVHGIPVFSLYGDSRRPTAAMMDAFDVLLCDVQDLGCRIYTYITTLLYMLEACAAAAKPVYILDRPNPAGREVEGTVLQEGWESFVGASRIIMRHGLTFGEMARWFVREHQLDVELHVVEMQDYAINQGPGYGWPTGVAWVNPSPNAASVNMARIFPGSVIFEGTTLSEGRGTTIALEAVGAPDLDMRAILAKMSDMQPAWLRGAKIRPCFFEPTFHKHQGQLCQAFQVHTDTVDYDPAAFKPYRMMVLFLKAIRSLYPDYPIWRQHAYEYEFERMPVDLINGGPLLRQWVDDNNAEPGDLENELQRDERQWRQQTADLLIYG